MASTGCCTLFLLVVSSAGVPLMTSEQTTNQTSIKSTNHTSEDTRNQTTEQPIMTMDEQIANARMVTRDKEKDENLEVHDFDMLLTPEQETAYQPLMTSDQKTNQTSVQRSSQTSIQSTNHTLEETTNQTTKQPIITMDEQIANARVVTKDNEKIEDKNLEVHDLDMMLTPEQEKAYQPLMTSDQKTNQTSVQTSSQKSIQSTNHTLEETTNQTTEQPIMTMDEQIANARMVTRDKEKSEDKNLEVHDLDMMLTPEQEKAYQPAPTKANTTAPQK